MKKRVLSLLLVLMMVVSLVPTAALAYKSDTDVEYAVTDGNIYFDKSTGTITYCDYRVTEAIIPDVIEGVPVTRIGDSAFYSCSQMTSIEIPGSVTSIGGSAFNSCTGLETITLKNCSITSGMNAITSPRLTALKNINIEGESSLYSSVDGVLFNKEKTSLIRYPSGKTATAYEIPNSVTSIERSAFAGCISLKSVTISDRVKSIGEHAFYGCTGLTNVTISNRVSSICNDAFSGCTGLTSIEIPNSVTSIGDSAFSGCTGLTNVTIPNSVTSIGGAVFSGCTGLISAKLPEKLSTISGSMFHNCTSLKSVDIPSNVTVIGGSAFSGCTGLTSIDIPSNVTVIGGSAFSGCTGLTSVDIPSSVTYIGGDAFSGCTGLTSIVIPGGVKIDTSDSDIFWGCTGLKSVVIQDGVTTLSTRMFKNCTSLTSISIPNSVTDLCGFVFEGCESLESIKLPDNLTHIWRSAFSGCTSLKSLTIPESVSILGAIMLNGNIAGGETFYNCKSLESINIPHGVTVIGSNTFFGCEKLKSIALPENLESKTLADSAFDGCTSLKTVSIPKSAATIGNSAFRDCSSIADVYYEGTEAEWNAIDFTFYNDSLKNANVHYGAYVPKTHNYVNGVCACGAKDPNQTHTHDYKSTVTAPTCTEQGYTTYTCSCGDSYVDSYTDALGHNYVDGECTRCHAKDPGQTHEHDYKSTVTEPTCTGAGYTTYTCTGCGHSYKDNYKDALGHDYKNGECTRCHAKDPNQTHEHNYKSTVTKPTCTEKGYTTHTCSCGDSYVDSYKDALGHLYIFGKCIRCGEKEDNSDTHTHDYKSRVVEPTCTEGGYTLWECECGKSYKTLHTKALGHEYKDGLCIRCGAKDPNAHTHKYVETVTKPTCTEKSYTTYTCSVCGDSYKGSYTDALGHSYANGSCTRCGAKDPNYKPSVSFIDVPETAYYYKSVQWAVANGITEGVGGNRFDPNGQCTRGQVVTFLWRAAGKPTVSANVSFSDVQPGAFYYEAVKWAVANGITTGVGGNRFAPNDSCTRGQVVTFLHRAENSPSASTVSSFTDVPSDAFYYNAVNWAVENGITSGVGNNRFAPNDTCTRGQVVTFLYRAQ